MVVSLSTVESNMMTTALQSKQENFLEAPSKTPDDQDQSGRNATRIPVIKLTSSAEEASSLANEDNMELTEHIESSSEMENSTSESLGLILVNMM